MKLTDIRRFHISEFVSDQSKAGRGTETVRKIATLLGTIFASPLKDELISANPARGVEKSKQDRDGVEPWEPDELRIFLGRCAQHRLALFEVAVLIGLRRGEITGLRWSDVDLVLERSWYGATG
jgi:integrase